VCDLIQDRLSRRAWALAALVPLATVATMLNPYGPAYWLHLRQVQSVTFVYIEEWLPVWRVGPNYEDCLMAGSGLLVLTLAAWTLNPARRWAHLGWVVALGGLLSGAVRHTWLMAVVCLIVLATNAARLDPEYLWGVFDRRVGRPAGPPPGYLRWLIRAALVVWLCGQLFVRWSWTQAPNELVPNRLSDGLVRFVQEHDLGGRVFNDYENSGYLQWRFGGEPALFIDLLNAYPDEVYQHYAEVVQASPRGLAVLEEKQIEWVVLTTNRPGHSLSRLANHLDAAPGWMRIYADNDGVIWVRRNRESERRWRAQAFRALRTSFFALEVFNMDAVPP
jgi:hypothetical protein